MNQQLPLAPAFFRSHAAHGWPELWELTAPISAAHGAGSHVSRQTIEAAGYRLPALPKDRAAAWRSTRRSMFSRMVLA